MTAAVTISGLSGIDTTTVINETLTAAGQPQQAEETALSSLQTKDSAYQTINSALAAIKTAADTVSDPATWQATTATSSDSSIVATGSNTALAGTSTTFSVTALAAAQVSTIALSDPNNADVASSGISIVTGYGTSSAATHQITPKSNSAADLVTAVNAANIGVKASLITTSTGTVLQFSSTASGAANAFNVTGLSDGAAQNLTNATDASISVGTAGQGGYSVTSSTNTFANAIPGVTFTASKLTTGATITVASDPSTASNAVQSMVSAVNSALSLINDNAGQGDILEGDSLVTSLTNQLLSAVSGGSSAGGSSFSIAGLDINEEGQMTFDSAAFATEYNADPSTTQSLVSNLSTQFSAVGDEASNAGTGSLTQAISSDADQEGSLTSEIADWTTKLADEKTSLTAKYAAMDAALSKMQSEQSYLASAFGTSSSSSSSSGLSSASVSAS
jgi:flagellar hook-associated protein 2